jgi:hypothetical protein
MAQLLAEQDGNRRFNRQGSTRNHGIRYHAELLFSKLLPIAKVPASRSLEANEFFVGTFHPKQTPIDQSNQYELKREANGFWGLMSGKMNWMFSTKSTVKRTDHSIASRYNYFS